MERNYIETFALRTRDCDMHGEWRPGAIMEAMQETATVHSDRLGIGRGDTIRLGLVWVLSRSKVEMRRLPGLGETVSVETYPTPPRHLFFPRAHVIRDAAGEEIGWANSLWLLMDLETRRAAGHPDILARMPDNADRPAPLGLPATIRPLPGEAARGTLRPLYSDLDLNGHVNNTKYLDWCLNALGVEVLDGARLTRFEINYEAEVRPGDTVETGLVLGDGAFSFCGELGGRRCFAVAGKLEKRERQGGAEPGRP